MKVHSENEGVLTKVRYVRNIEMFVMSLCIGTFNFQKTFGHHQIDGLKSEDYVNQSEHIA